MEIWCQSFTVDLAEKFTESNGDLSPWGKSIVGPSGKAKVQKLKLLF